MPPCNSSPPVTLTPRQHWAARHQVSAADTNTLANWCNRAMRQNEHECNGDPHPRTGRSARLQGAGERPAPEHLYPRRRRHPLTRVAPMPSPLDVKCPHCKAEPGEKCRRYDGIACIPHHHRTNAMRKANRPPTPPPPPKPKQGSLFDDE